MREPRDDDVVGAPHPAIPRATVRELDRLSRAAHRFHRYAHHPLCDEYASEVVRVGRKGRVCRGCANALAGALGGAAVAVLMPGIEPALAFTAVGVGALAVGSSFALGARSGAPKWLTRGFPALALAFGAVAGARIGGGAGAGVSSSALAIVVATTALYRARRPDRSPCATCPEREGSVACRGLRPIVLRERAFQRRARSLIDAAFAARPVVAAAVLAASLPHG